MVSNDNNTTFTIGSKDRARFAVGNLVQHKLLDYRGVVIDVHEDFQGSEDWYESEAKTKPSKNQPWYEVLVHGSARVSYVAQQNLDCDLTGMPVDHPLIRMFFNEFHSAKYHVGGPMN
ncbi:MAG: heat shock protein HspQ [bacterium]